MVFYSYENFLRQSEPLLKKIKILIDEILHTYQHIQINKRICGMLLDRIHKIETFVSSSKYRPKEVLTKSAMQHQHYQHCYNTLHQLLYLLDQTREFINDISHLKTLRKCLNIEQKFIKIIERYDEICKTLQIIDPSTIKESNTQKEMRRLQLDLENNKKVK